MASVEARIILAVMRRDVREKDMADGRWAVGPMRLEVDMDPDEYEKALGELQALELIDYESAEVMVLTDRGREAMADAGLYNRLMGI